VTPESTPVDSDAPEEPQGTEATEETTAEAGPDWKAEARKHERRAKQVAAELEELRKAQMSDGERAVAEAEERGRLSARTEVVRTAAVAELRASAAEAGVKLGALVDLIDVGRLVTDDGQVDSDAVAAVVKQLADQGQQQTLPPAGPPPGPRGGGDPQPTDRNSQFRQMFGR
jgi:hypothetical protein